MKKIISFIVAALLLFSVLSVFTAASPESNSASTDGISVNAKSAILMEASTGKILYSQNDEYYNSAASVTKIMTLLLVCDALAEGRYKLEDTVCISEYASSMGGSQVFLKEGERLSVEELLKCTVIASANDAAVALAEYTEGSEAAFVHKMNAKARELGLKKTSFENATGLDEDTVEHYTCTYDIAVMSRELIKHEIITKYSSLWQDSIRNGEFILTNTNRLVRFYDGCNGLKTGSTDKAGFCISVTAKRADMQLIAVIMNADTITERNNSARALLDYGFSNYALYKYESEELEKTPVFFGKSDILSIRALPFSAVVKRSDLSKVEAFYELPENVCAPIANGQKVGSVTFKLGNEILGMSDVVSCYAVDKISFFGIFFRMLKNIFV